jgi:hypothetical protein
MQYMGRINTILIIAAIATNVSMTLFLLSQRDNSYVGWMAATIGWIAALAYKLRKGDR